MSPPSAARLQPPTSKSTHTQLPAPLSPTSAQLLRYTITGYAHIAEALLFPTLQIIGLVLTRAYQSVVGTTQKPVQHMQPLPQWYKQLDARYVIVLFDGVCAVCNVFITFLIDYDYDKRHKFASLQSDVGRELLQLHHIPTTLDSMVFIERTDRNDVGKAYIKSTAALRSVAGLGRLWYVLATLVLYLVPRFLRDIGYTQFARWRYTIFGTVQPNNCRRVTKDIRSRFLEDSTLHTNATAAELHKVIEDSNREVKQ